MKVYVKSHKHKQRDSRRRGSGSSSRSEVVIERAPRPRSRNRRPSKKGAVGERVGFLAPPGMGVAVLRELELRKITFSQVRQIKVRNHDLVIVSLAERKPATLPQLTTVEDVFYMLEEGLPISSRRDLRQIDPGVLKECILKALQQKLDRRARNSATTNYWVFVKQDRDHEVYRKEIAQGIVDLVGGQFAKWRAKDPADVEIWGFLAEGQLAFGLRLSGPSYKRRSYRETERDGSLRPTIAACMAALSGVSEGAELAVLDPMCGSGTLLFECLLLNPAAKLVGIDRDPEAIEIVNQSARKLGLTSEFLALCGDSTDDQTLDELTERFDLIISNLPFGVKFENSSLADLYTKALMAWKPLLIGTGSMAILVSDERPMYSAIERAKVKLKKAYRLRVVGREGTIFILKP